MSNKNHFDSDPKFVVMAARSRQTCPSLPTFLYRMPDKFDIIVQDLQRLVASGAGIGMFGEETHGYRMNLTLSDDEVSTFESQHGVRLHDDHRQFLIRVGNGGAGPYYGLFSLGEVDDGFGFGPWGDFIGQLPLPFPHTAPWNNIADKPEYNEDDEEFDNLIEAFDERYFDPGQVNGAIPICHLGCARRQWLVITGPEAGNIWCDDRADYKGLYPLQTQRHKRVTFFGWYRNWLDEALGKLQLWEKSTRP
jgi:hypothetical protein